MKNARIKVLIVGEAVTAAHVIRPLGLARGLKEQGHDVVFACDGRYEPMVRTEDMAWEPLACIPRAVFLDRLDRGASLYTRRELQGYVQDDLRVIAAVKPDVVVGDFRISMGISAELCDVPYLALSNVHWSPQSSLPLPVPEHWLVDLMGVSMAGRVIGALVPHFFRIQARASNRLRAGYGLARIGGRGAPDVYTRGTRTLYLDTPELYGNIPLGPDEHCIGPVLWAPSPAMPEWWNELPTDRPVVWLSAGSSGDAVALGRVAGILADSGMAVMATTVGRMPGLASSIFTAPFIPGLAAAERADLVVCNGGSGLVYQALAKGRPVLGIPRNMDQYYVMEAVQRQGAGRLVRSGTMTVDAVREAALDLLNDARYPAAAERQGRAIRAMDPVSELVRVMESVVAEREAARVGERREFVPAHRWETEGLTAAVS